MINKYNVNDKLYFIRRSLDTILIKKVAIRNITITANGVNYITYDNFLGAASESELFTKKEEVLDKLANILPIITKEEN